MIIRQIKAGKLKSVKRLTVMMFMGIMAFIGTMRLYP